MILTAAILLSIVAHAVLMFVLRSCSFNTFADTVRSHRKWTRDLPSMHVVRHVGDPFSRESERGRPSAAPVVETMQDRVARLAEQPAEKMLSAPPAEIKAPQEESITPPEPQVAEWKMQKRPEVLDYPVANEDAPPVPQAVDMKSVLPTDKDVMPPVDVPSAVASAIPPPAKPEAMAAAEPLPPVPPAVGFGNGADGDSLLTYGAMAMSDAVKDAANALAKKPPSDEKPPSAADGKDTAKDMPLPVMPKVDENVVKEEKKAVEKLRDEQASAPLARHVRCELAYWTDPKHMDYRYFRLRISSNPRNPLEVVPKDVVYLLDASGSIANDRLKSCRNAISEAIRTLNSNDRFNVVAFRDKFTYLFDVWHYVDAESVDQTDKWLRKLTAHGRTDVFKTLRSVLAVPRSPERPLIALVVTDGEATSGMTRSAEIISAFSELNGGLVSIYMYGVKDEANAYLMDMLARGNRGEWSRHAGLRWRAASGIPDLADRFRDPVLTDISISFAASSRVDTYPDRVTHLYANSPIDIYGLCPSSSKEVVFVVRGLNGKQPYEDVFRLAFDPSKTLTADVKREWAQRRMYELVGEYSCRPNDRLLREIKLFSRQFGVAIPYESELGKTDVRK